MRSLCVFPQLKLFINACLYRQCTRLLNIAFRRIACPLDDFNFNDTSANFMHIRHAALISMLSSTNVAFFFFFFFFRFTGGSSGLEELRLSLAKQGPLASAFRAALALVDDSIAAKLVPELLGLLRRGGGLATRVTAATAVDSLCQSVGKIIQTLLFVSL